MAPSIIGHQPDAALPLKGEHAEKLLRALHELSGLAHCLRVIGRADEDEGRNLIADDALHALGASMIEAARRAFNALDASSMSTQGGAQ